MATIRAIRTLAPQVRTILTSGVNARLETESIASLPIHGRLSKPYSADQLLQTVHDVLHGKE